eukprot:8305081-Lingulodinium_polyedra.AAC.1
MLKKGGLLRASTSSVIWSLASLAPVAKSNHDRTGPPRPCCVGECCCGAASLAQPYRGGGEVAGGLWRALLR